MIIVITEMDERKYDADNWLINDMGTLLVTKKEITVATYSPPVWHYVFRADSETPDDTSKKAHPAARPGDPDYIEAQIADETDDPF